MRLLLLGFMLLPLQGAVIYMENPSSPVVATNIVDPMTGADLAGLSVTANYSGFGINALWQATGATSGATAANPLFSLSLTGNTDGTLAWQYTPGAPQTLLSLVLDGSAAGIYFDRTNPSPGVPGSGPGIDMAFSFTPPPGFDIFVIYSGPVNYAGSPHDLFTKVTIQFGGNGGAAGFAPQPFQFTQDTDRSVVPEPGASTMILAGVGLLGVQSVMRRYLRSAAGRKANMH